LEAKYSEATMLSESPAVTAAGAEVLGLVREEAAAAKEAAGRLSDGQVAVALREAAAGLRARRNEILDANAEDVAAAEGALDEGALDRLRLTPRRLDELEAQLREVADLPPLDRLIDEWTLPNGLRVSMHRIPVGVIGANFEARPTVAVDIASQLLKSLNACVLRTGGAALRSVTLLVDAVLRPALGSAGLPAEAVGLARTESREGAAALVSLPGEIPLVILRGSGRTTSELGRLAAANGVATLAHAEGGGVLYIDADADLERAERVVRASLDRLGVCNRLNLLLVHERLAPHLPRLVALLDDLEIAVHGTPRARAAATIEPLEVTLGHEWANDPGHVATVTCDLVASLDEAAAIANAATSGLAAAIVTEDEEAAQRFLDGYRGTTALWNTTTRFTDGHALTGTPETGINVGWAPGARGPVTYRDLWLRQYRVVGDGSQRRS
jgi:glutamate-5-semialdehyde dehydrogenase